MIALLFKRFRVLGFHYYLLLWSIHRIYYTALKMFKIYYSNAVDSNDDEDDYLSESSVGEGN